MTQNPPPTEPGWYPDPWGAAPDRYFDGTAWTPHTLGGAPTPVMTVTAPRRLPFAAPGTLGRWGMALGALSVSLNAIVIVLGTIFLTDYNHELFRRIADGRTSGPAPTPPAAAALLNFITLPALLATLGMYVLLIMWGFRIAKNGAALGLPARLSPGWAIGGWFIPIGNLFVPCMSMVGAAPAALRSRVVRWWITFIAASLAGLPAVIAQVVGYVTGDNRVAVFITSAALVAVLALSILQVIWGLALTRDIDAGHSAPAAAEPV